MAEDWQQISVRADGKREAEIAELLATLGAIAVTTEGADSELWLEAGLPTEPHWSQVTVTGLYENQVDTENLVAVLGAQLDGVDVARTALADRDWERECLDQFKAFEVGEGLWVVPSWSEPVEEARCVLRLDPGLAFGTGSHPTTRLCLQWLSTASVNDRTVVDYGCGSGILAIAALLLGARSAQGIDIDPRALIAARENAERNEVADRMRLALPNEAIVERADIVIANILAGTLIELRAHLLEFLAPGGTLLLSGILREQADTVAAAYAEVGVFAQISRDDWMLLISD